MEHRCPDCFVRDKKIYCDNIIKTLEDKIAEQNEYIKFLENRPGNHDCKNCPNRQQLFKDNSKYDKLESKEE